MSILLNKQTKVIVQGITGAQASFHTQRAMKYGTNIVAGVVPNKKDTLHLGVPLFGTVKEAKEKTGADTSLVFVPAKFAKTAILEAIRAELSLVVVITSGIPVSDMMEIKNELKNSKTMLIGPNTPGIITPQEAYIGVFPDNIHQKGNIGVISRSSTLTYEVILGLKNAGFGESTIIGLGDDFIIGTDFIDLISKFNADKSTKVIVLIGGVGGHYEAEVAAFYKSLKKKKPIVALIIDRTYTIKDDDMLATEFVASGMTEQQKPKSLLEDVGISVVDNIQALNDVLTRIC